MLAAPASRIRANSTLVVSLSPVAIGMLVPAATRAIPAMSSGGVGSSNHSGSYGSNLEARRAAPEDVNWP